jgi:hypothetical protein
MKTRTIIKSGIAAIAVGAAFGVSLPVKADTPLWVRAQNPDSFRIRGLVPPGSYSNKDNQKAATIAVSKSAKCVGGKKQTVSKLEQKGNQLH